MCFPTRTQSGQANLRGDHVLGHVSNFKFKFDRATHDAKAFTKHAKNAKEHIVIVPSEPIPPAQLETLREWASRPKYTASKFGCFDGSDGSDADFDF